MSLAAGAVDEAVITAAAIVVPVHDEEARLARCLEAIDAAGVASGLPTGAVQVVVVLDRCTDTSAAIAAAHRARAILSTTIVTIAAGNVGTARARGVACALDRLAALDRAATWLATTDADSQVPVMWLADQLGLAAAGAEAVAGLVAVDDWSEHPAHVPIRFTRHYAPASLRHEPHGHVHGANLGVRADAYLAVGGFPDLASSEDVALWRALGDAGHRRVATRAIVVLTSGRSRARAPSGFAARLLSLAAEDSLDAPLDGAHPVPPARSLDAAG